MPGQPTDFLAGRIAWVTGAASGIGACIASAYAGAGATVAALDIDAEGLGALRARHDASAIVTAPLDVASWEDTRATCAQLVERLGPPSVVASNAGISPSWVPVAEADPDEWARVISVNLSGAFHVAKAAADHLRATAPSSLMFTASVMGLGAGPGGAAYHASKHGVVGLMRSMANELGAAGVRVNALCPGWVDTPMLDDDIAESGGERGAEQASRARQHLLPGLIEPDDVADAALFLASPAASRMTGIALPVDAGMMEQRQWLSRAWQYAGAGSPGAAPNLAVGRGTGP